MILMLLAVGCGKFQPAPFQHSEAMQLEPCASCHELDRPVIEHFAGKDCSECHSASFEHWTLDDFVHTFSRENAHAVDCYPCHFDEKKQAYDYEISPLCMDCHEGDRPGAGHHPGQDCGGSGCHTPTDWDDADDD
jgi:hypothetical protein